MANRGKNWRRWFGYQWLVNNMVYFLFLAALAIVYIYNGHYADKVSRDIGRTGGELKELEYEYKTVKGEILLRSKESEVEKAVAPLGLKPLQAPPIPVSDSL
jgi:Bacteriodetes cell division protein (FtsL-like)